MDVLAQIVRQGGSVIELGGGTSPLFHPNVDIRWEKGVDIVASLNHPLPVASEQYDSLYCRYALEHVSWRSIRGLLSECHRILKPGGIGVFITANLLEQARVLVETEKWSDDLVCMVFGDNNYPENTHRCGFSPEYARRLFKEAGFYRVEVEPIQTAAGPTDMTVTVHKSKAVIS